MFVSRNKERIEPPGRKYRPCWHRMKRRGTVLRGGGGNRIPACLRSAGRDRCWLTPVPGQQGRQAAGRARRCSPISHHRSGRHWRWEIAGAVGDTAAQFVRQVDRTRFSRTAFALRTLWARSCRRKRLATDDGRQDDRPKRHNQPVRGAVSHDCSPPGSIADLRGNAGSAQSITGDRLDGIYSSKQDGLPHPKGIPSRDSARRYAVSTRRVAAPSVMPRLQLPGTHSRCKESAFARLED